MKEKIYTIPVSEAFDADTECALCYMKKVLEEDALNYVMGPSYMEDDVRTVTNQLGFCMKHVEQLSQRKNTLGLALMLHTHMAKVNKDLKKLVPDNEKNGLFKKKVDPSQLLAYINNLQTSCYICNKVDETMERYIDTIFMLWAKEGTFREKFNHSKGFCTYHYGKLYQKSIETLSGKQSTLFLEELNRLYFENIQRVSDDLDWFIKKFDYLNHDKPWKDSKDAVPRTMIKTNSKI